MFFRYLGDGFKLPTRNSEEPYIFYVLKEYGTAVLKIRLISPFEPPLLKSKNILSEIEWKPGLSTYRQQFTDSSCNG